MLSMITLRGSLSCYTPRRTSTSTTSSSFLSCASHVSTTPSSWRSFASPVVYSHKPPPPPPKPVFSRPSKEEIAEMKRLREESPHTNTQSVLAKQFNVSPFYVACVAPCPEEPRRINIERNKANSKKLRRARMKEENKNRLYHWLRKNATQQYHDFRAKQMGSMVPKKPKKKTILERAYDVYRGKHLTLTERKKRVRKVKVERWMEKQIAQSAVQLQSGGGENDPPRHIKDSDLTSNALSG